MGRIETRRMIHLDRRAFSELDPFLLVISQNRVDSFSR